MPTSSPSADDSHFKKKDQADRFRYPDQKQIKLDQANPAAFFCPNLAGLRYRNSRGDGRSEEHHREPV